MALLEEVGRSFADHDGICIHNMTDNYCDTLHIDPQALRPIAAALLAAARDVPERAGPAVVVQFPTRARDLESYRRRLFDGGFRRSARTASIRR